MRYSVILLVVIGLLASGCASREAPSTAEIEQKMLEVRTEESALIKKTILDKGRAELMLGLLDERDKLMARHVEVLREYSEEILSMNMDYDVTREQFEQKLSSYNNTRSTLQIDFSKLIESMKKNTTAEEWEIISKYQLKNIHPRELVNQQVLGGS